MHIHESLGLTIEQLNAMTKYQSIEHYHAFEAREGSKRPSLAEETMQPPAEPLLATEKIDGTNVRILVRDGQWILGGRETFVRASGDLLFDPSNGIGEHLEKIAIECAEKCDSVVLYGELYGGNINGHRSYTSVGAVGFRVFDAALMNAQDVEDIAHMTPSEIAGWRQRGMQRFVASDFLSMSFGWLNTVPYLYIPCPPPTNLEETYEWLRTVLPQRSKAAMDDGVNGMVEGLVIRTEDRGWIRKLRIEDYARAVRGKSAAKN